MSSEADFRVAMRDAGINPPDNIVADGRLHRFDVNDDRRGTRNGWYVLYPDDPAAGVFGCWKRAISQTWRAERARLTPEEGSRQGERIAQAIQAQAAEKRKRHEAALRQATRIIAKAPAATSHPYLDRKHVGSHGLHLASDGRLVVPVLGSDGSLQSLQYIAADGTKRFLADAPVAGGNFTIGVIQDKAVVCEGYATGATIHETTGLPVVIAFNAGNLEPVSKNLRKAHPEAQLIIAADDDRNTPGNPGVSHATPAAKAVRARLVVPTFGPESTGTDFNDMMAESGAEAVRSAIQEPRHDDVELDQEDGAQAHDDDTDAALDRLAALGPLAYEQERKSAAKALDIRATVLDTAVRNRREASTKSDTGFLADVEPWPDPVDGADLLDELVDKARRHLYLPAGGPETVALWTVHTHAHDAAEVSPILAATSPTPECGKTTTLTLLQGTVRKALPASNITAAALFRAVEKYKPTLLIDEADTFLHDNDELRGVLNSGHARAGAYVVRTVGDTHEPEVFRTWAPKAIALIGKLPATLASRAVHIELKRLAPGETVEPLRLHQLDNLQPLQRQAARWAGDNLEKLRHHEPSIPPELYGRAADNWRPLLSIADLAGGQWPQRARQAAITLSATRSEQTAGILLLEDLRSLFDGRDRLATAEILEALNAMDDRPWPEWTRGREMTARGLGKLLQPFGIKPRTIRFPNGVAKGYELEQLGDAFSRYLPPKLSVTPLQPADRAEKRPSASVTSGGHVTDSDPEVLALQSQCYGVTDGEPWRARV